MGEGKKGQPISEHGEAHDVGQALYMLKIRLAWFTCNFRAYSLPASLVNHVVTAQASAKKKQPSDSPQRALGIFWKPHTCSTGASTANRKLIQ